MPSIPEALYCVYALNRLGAVANMIHPLASENEIRHYLNEVKSTVFVMFTGTYELCKESISKTDVKKAIVVSPAQSLSLPFKTIYHLKNKKPSFHENSIFLSWDEFMKGGNGINIEFHSHNPNEMAVISHTGGTTGEPKGVMCSDRNINSLISQISCCMDYDRQERYMSVLPPFINYSLVNSMLEPLYFGFTVILIPQYDPHKFFDYIKKYRPNHISSIPNYWETVITMPQ